ncbi:MAG: DUF4124 domain-containing protein [Desulfosalsimonas sp.]
MRFLLLCLIVFAVVFAGSVYAELYRYEDSRGVVHFTDNPGSIPEKYSDSVKMQREIKRAPLENSDESPGPGREKGAEEKGAEDAEAEEKANPELRTERQNLVEQREALQKEYEQLEEERKRLSDNPPSDSASNDEKKEYSQKIKEINNRIDDYQQKAEAFDKKVEAFNSKVNKQADGSE